MNQFEAERQYAEVFAAFVRHVEREHGDPAIDITERQVTAVWFLNERNHGIHVARELNGVKEVHAWSHDNARPVGWVTIAIRPDQPVTREHLECAARAVGLLPAEHRPNTLGWPEDVLRAPVDPMETGTDR